MNAAPVFEVWGGTQEIYVEYFPESGETRVDGWEKRIMETPNDFVDPRWRKIAIRAIFDEFHPYGWNKIEYGWASWYHDAQSEVWVLDLSGDRESFVSETMDLIVEQGFWW